MSGRCGWAQGESMTAYHDNEWGVPVYDDRLLFEFLTLEGAQAGLTWSTILKRRENYRQALDNFRPEIITTYDEDKVAALLQNPGIIRNRLKIRSVIRNARAFVDIQGEFGSFSKYIWRFVDGKPLQNHLQSMSEIPAKTPQSEGMSKDLIKRGFTFVGPTICYAFMQAVGLVNDHTVDCFRYTELGGK
ncbi:MAG: DNA-3-methyladenine glycosylase I [Chloroflexi bacterium]|nr:DNA-3-methyladenine glycosylase I [Chloroflexota bacterium]